MQYNITVNGKQFNVGVQRVGDTAVASSAAPVAAATPAPSAGGAGTPVASPMPGNVFKMVCSQGQQVSEGDVLLVLEAMKMEIEVNAPTSGVVQSIGTSVGSSVNTGDVLLTIG
ncbi:MAG: biotin/lipoyl-containing protein [Eubacteriales bacterium]